MNDQLPGPGGKKPEDVWNKVLRAALAIPGSKVDREAFLRRALSKHVPDEVWQCAIEETPHAAGISQETIRKIAASAIKWHRAGVSSVSFAAGLPGGWWVAGTMPADLSQFFWHVIVVAQKLAYLYGWPELSSEDGELDDETLLLLTLLIGVMLGAESAGKAISKLAERLATQVAGRLPKKALTKWGIYRLAREVAKWLGIKLTKDSFSRALAKMVPVLGGIISGTVTWVAFTTMTNRLARHLESLPLAGGE